MCSRWLAAQGARPVASDLSAGMLRARPARRRRRPASWCRSSRPTRSTCRSPSASFDIAFTAFGAVPFVADSAAVMREAARVLMPGGRWVFATSHPTRWAFPDDPARTG